MPKQSYTILGAGALGGYYGARLLHAGHTVRFLVRGDYEHIRAHGMRVESMHGDLALPEVEVYCEPSALQPSDVAVVALKTTQSGVLAGMLPGAVKPDGVALVLQNGLHPESAVADLVGAGRVVGGLCFLCSNRVGPGHFRQVRFDHIQVGEYLERGVSPRIQAIAADLCAASVRTEAVADLPLARWKKLVWNIPYNGLSAVLDADTSRLMGDPQRAAQVEALMHEVAGTAQASGGHVIPPELIQAMLDNTRKMGPYLPSMQIDRRLGRAMEVESIHGDAVRAARRAGYAAPLMEALYRQLQTLDHARQPV